MACQIGACDQLPNLLDTLQYHHVQKRIVNTEGSCKHVYNSVIAAVG